MNKVVTLNLIVMSKTLSFSVNLPSFFFFYSPMLNKHLTLYYKLTCKNSIIVMQVQHVPSSNAFFFFLRLSYYSSMDIFTIKIQSKVTWINNTQAWSKILSSLIYRNIFTLPCINGWKIDPYMIITI